MELPNAQMDIKLKIVIKANVEICNTFVFIISDLSFVLIKDD